MVVQSLSDGSPISSYIRTSCIAPASQGLSMTGNGLTAPICRLCDYEVSLSDNGHGGL